MVVVTYDGEKLDLSIFNRKTNKVISATISHNAEVIHIYKKCNDRYDYIGVILLRGELSMGFFDHPEKIEVKGYRVYIYLP